MAPPHTRPGHDHEHGHSHGHDHDHEHAVPEAQDDAHHHDHDDHNPDTHDHGDHDQSHDDHGHDDHSHDDHSHGHGHGHAHGHHAHSHAPTDFGGRFLIAAGLNGLFILGEVFFGFRANSLALLADAGHNFSDALGLLMAWGAWWLGRRPPQPTFTYGFRGASILAALFNALLLLVAIGGIIFEAVQRLMSPEPSQGGVIMGVAACGIVVNGVTAWLFSKGQDDLNVKAAFAHLASDAVISAAVVVSGLIMLMTHWLWLDPVVSVVVSAVIVWGTWGLLRDAVKLSLQGVPSGIDFDAVKRYIAGLPGVTKVCDLHIWGMSTTEVALTAHIVMPDGHPGDAFLRDLAKVLKAKHGIIHATVQIETSDVAHVCALKPDPTVNAR